MSASILLTELLHRASLPTPASKYKEVVVKNIVADSRQVTPGSLFVAMEGVNCDSHRFIPEVIKNGAIAILGTHPIQNLAVPYTLVEDSRQTLASLAAAFYDFPARKMTVIGITGTDGKTTTANLIFQILKEAGVCVGMISTVNAVIGDQVLDTGFHVTTPDALDIQRYLSLMVNQGVTHVILEATSHGLAQKRVAACEFDFAVVTNITHEHLDYHGSQDAYRTAKGYLFTSLSETVSKPHVKSKLAVLNRDDSSYDYLSSITPVDMVTYGYHPQADIQPQNIQSNVNGLHFNIEGKNLHFLVESSLIGGYNVFNILAAITTTAIGLRLDPQIIQRGIKTLTTIPGRAEKILMGQEFTVIVDFAHTPNALLNILKTARQFSKGRIIALLGSAGLRDRAKRRMMAEIAIQLADITILTAEDPRTESLDDILHEMASAAQANGGIESQTFWIFPDRREAIRFAVRQAQSEDVVIACGKGHEQSMCIGTTEYPWDDRIAMQAALSELLSIPGPEMPYLPSALL